LLPFPLKFAAQKNNFCCPKNNQIADQSNNFAAQINEICCPNLRQPFFRILDIKGFFCEEFDFKCSEKFFRL
jgi:hypothetical protein